MIDNEHPRRDGRRFAAALLLCLTFAPLTVAAEARQRYVCPMHASVESKAPGSCPKCGMALRLASDEPDPEPSAAPPSKIVIPDVELLDQDGRKVRFHTDLVKGQVVAINFVFTTCTTICPPLGATFGKVQTDLGARAGNGVRLISISVDPVTDTPERLKAWGAKFHAGPGWTFVTGEKSRVDELLRALGAATARREDHSPIVLVGNDALGQWTRTDGLAKPSQILAVIDDAVAGRLDPKPPERHARDRSAARQYFTDVELLDQDGRPVRFYSDVLEGKTVVVNAFFTTCTSVCPPMSRNMERLQEALGDRVGRDVFLVSITVDPQTDTPERLKAYARQFHAKPGWIFLTGTKRNVDWALYKLGQYVERRDDHTTIWIIGNEATGLWKKAHGLAKSDELVKIVEATAADR